MASKKRRAEIPDSEDEPMTSSPIDDDTDKLPAKNVEAANTQPDNTPQQQHMTVEATSKEEKSLQELENPETFKISEQPDDSDSSGQPLGERMQQEVDQGIRIDPEGVLKPCSLHTHVLVGVRNGDSEPSPELEVGEQMPEQAAENGGLPGSEELENTPTEARADGFGGYTSLRDEPKPVGLELTQAEPAKQDQPDDSHTVGIEQTTSSTQSPFLEEQRKGLPVSVSNLTSASTTIQELSKSTPTQELGSTTVAVHVSPSMKERHPERPEQMSATKATSGPDILSPAKGSQEATIAELRAQRAALIASLAALSNVQELIAEVEDDDDSSRGPYEGPTDAEVMTAANKIVKTHIKLLHEYNEMKDVGQGLMGLIADSRGVRIVEVQDEFGIDAKD